MFNRRVVFFTGLLLILAMNSWVIAAQAPDMKFDHNHTFQEVVDYLNGMVKAYPKLALLHSIGKSYLGNDLLVIVITNQETGKCKDKPGYWFDGNLHASEVMGAEVCLHTIHTLLTQYGKDPAITKLVDTRTIFIMPKLNPDGSDHYLTKPDSMRSSVRPHDSDRDGLLDEDPPEDIAEEKMEWEDTGVSLNLNFNDEMARKLRQIVSATEHPGEGFDAGLLERILNGMADIDPSIDGSGY